jgi:hypothetical protein
VRRLAKRIGVHVYGACGDRTCGKDRRLRNPYSVDRDPCFELVARDYKFYLSFENDICTDYITEKAYNALQLDTVPVVLSGARLADELPPGAVVDALARTPEQLAEHLFALLADPAAYQAHFDWRRRYRAASHQSVPSPCGLCKVMSNIEPCLYCRSRRCTLLSGNGRRPIQTWPTGSTSTPGAGEGRPYPSTARRAVQCSAVQCSAVQCSAVQCRLPYR